MSKQRIRKIETLSKTKNLLNVSKYSVDNDDIYINKDQKDFYSGKISSSEYFIKKNNELNKFTRKLRSLKTGLLFDDSNYVEKADLNKDQLTKLGISTDNYFFKPTLNKSNPYLSPYIEYYSKRQLFSLINFVSYTVYNRTPDTLNIKDVSKDIEFNVFYKFYTNLIVFIKESSKKTNSYFVQGNLNENLVYTNNSGKLFNTELTTEFKEKLQELGHVFYYDPNGRSTQVYNKVFNSNSYSNRTLNNTVVSGESMISRIFNDDLLNIYGFYLLKNKKLKNVTEKDIITGIIEFSKIDRGYFEDVFNSMYLDNNIKKFKKNSTLKKINTILKSYNYSKHILFKDNLSFCNAYTYMYMHLILNKLILKEITAEDINQEEKQEDNQNQQPNQNPKQDSNQDQNLEISSNKKDDGSDELNSNSNNQEDNLSVEVINVEAGNNSNDSGDDNNASDNNNNNNNNEKDDSPDLDFMFKGVTASKEDTDPNNHKFIDKETLENNKVDYVFNELKEQVNKILENSKLGEVIQKLEDIKSKLPDMGRVITNDPFIYNSTVEFNSNYNVIYHPEIDTNNKINLANKIKLPKKEFIKALTTTLFEDSIKGITSVKVDDIEFLDSEYIEELQELQYLHPMFKNTLIDEVYSQTTFRSGKFDIYIDFSGSMDDYSLTMIKSIVLELINLKLVKNVYFFDTNVYKVMGTNEVANHNLIASIKQQGGTSLQTVIRQVKSNKNTKSLVFTDGQDLLSIYTDNVVFIGIEGSNFHSINRNVLNNYIAKRQLLFFRTKLEEDYSSMKSNIHIIKDNVNLYFSDIFKNYYF